MKFTAENIIIIIIVIVAVIGTLIFMKQKGVRPNSVIGRAMGKDGSCELKQCKIKLKPSNLYYKYCEFHIDFVKLNKRKTLDSKTRKVVEQVILLDASELSNSEKKDFLKKIRNRVTKK